MRPAGGQAGRIHAACVHQHKGFVVVQIFPPHLTKGTLLPSAASALHLKRATSVDSCKACPELQRAVPELQHGQATSAHLALLRRGWALCRAAMASVPAWAAGTRGAHAQLAKGFGSICRRWTARQSVSGWLGLVAQATIQSGQGLEQHRKEHMPARTGLTHNGTNKRIRQAGAGKRPGVSFGVTAAHPLRWRRCAPPSVRCPPLPHWVAQLPTVGPGLGPSQWLVPGLQQGRACCRQGSRMRLPPCAAFWESARP